MLTSYMQYTAEAKNLKMSPRKMRLVVDGIKKMQIIKALAILEVSNKRASDPIRKAIKSAMANATHNGKVNKEDLFIAEMFVNEGISNKRYHYAARGRIRPYKKRTSHLKVILGVREKAQEVSLIKQDESDTKSDIKNKKENIKNKETKGGIK